MSTHGVITYQARAQQHRPRDPLALAREIRRLAHEERWTPVAIAESLRVELVLVQRVLATAEDRAA